MAIFVYHPESKMRIGNESLCGNSVSQMSSCLRTSSQAKILRDQDTSGSCEK